MDSDYILRLIALAQFSSVRELSLVSTDLTGKDEPFVNNECDSWSVKN